jgi:methionyl aminopeptidase
LIIQKSPDEIKRIRDSCLIVTEILASLKNMIAEGINTQELDRVAETIIYRRKAQPAFKGYRGYPATICASINSQVVHGIPSTKRKLKQGDIISIDLGVYYNGFYGDAAYTYPVGKVNERTQRLLRISEESLYRGIEKASEGNRLFDISHAIQSYVEQNGYSVVRDFVGHGIGRSLHEEPQIPNYGKKGRGPRLKKGMALAIEPMVNEGTWEVEILADGWTAVTKDGKLSSHFEHTVAITQNGPLILTKL